MVPLLELQQVSVRYRRGLSLFRRDDLWALREVSLELCRGDALAVVGGNGSGKSTLLRLLAGIIAPDRGRVVNHGAEVGLLALGLGFLPHLSGRDNIYLSGMLLGMARREIARKFEEIVAFSELGERIEDPVRTYSAGMRARLGFAIALQLDPDILLIDEVLAVGDARFQQKSRRALLAKISGQRGAVVLVSHHPSLLRALCNRAIWLEEGRIRAQGRVEEVLSQYGAEKERSRRPADSLN